MKNLFNQFYKVNFTVHSDLNCHKQQQVKELLWWAVVINQNESKPTKTFYNKGVLFRNPMERELL